MSEQAVRLLPEPSDRQRDAEIVRVLSRNGSHVRLTANQRRLLEKADAADRAVRAGSTDQH